MKSSHNISKCIEIMSKNKVNTTMNKNISKDEQVPSQSTTVQSAHLALSGQTKGFKRLLPFLGPAFIASVAYIDPGNFATNIAALIPIWVFITLGNTRF